MNEVDRRRELSAAWMERAGMRLTECEAELRKRSGVGGKLTARAERYRDLIAFLRRTLGEEERPVAHPPIEDLDHDLAVLKERLLALAREMARAKDEWRRLKTRWGASVDQTMREREARGEPPGKPPTLDFRISPPPADLSPEERAAHEIVRSLGL